MKYTYDDWFVEINCYFKENTVNFYGIGRSFKKLVQSRLYLAYFPDLKTCAKIEFKMSVKQVYNYMAVYDRFYNNSAYSDYSFSQLLELVYVPDDEIQELGITLDMSVREIRKMVRPPKPQPLKIGLSSEEKKERKKEEIYEKIQEIESCEDKDSLKVLCAELRELVSQV